MKNDEQIKLNSQQVQLSLNQLTNLIVYIGEGDQEVRDLISFLEMIFYSELSLKKYHTLLDSLKTGIFLISKMKNYLNKDVSRINESALLLNQDLFQNIGNTNNHSIDIYILNLINDLKIITSSNLHQLVNNLSNDKFYIITLETVKEIKKEFKPDIDYLRSNLEQFKTNEEVNIYIKDSINANRQIFFNKSIQVINKLNQKIKLKIEIEDENSVQYSIQNVSTEKEIELYECLDQNCKREYSDAGQLVKHMINAHGTNCIACRNSYSQVYQLAKHYFEHHEQERFKCRVEDCKNKDFKYCSYRKFKKHMKNVHEIDYEFEL